MRAAGTVTFAAVLALALGGCGPGGTKQARTPPTSPRTSALTVSPGGSVAAHGPRATVAARRSAFPHPDHIVVVILENSSYDQVVGRAEAPFLNSLERSAAVFTRSYAVTHPSQPNYLALFSGSTHGITDDTCPIRLDAPNLARSLLDAGRTFTGYSEDLPSAGYAGCSAAGYARKHNPWADFTNLPPSVNQPLTALPGDFTRLPTVSFVIPNLTHDLHDGTLAQADQWLHDHLGGYAAWALTHNSLLVVTSDEDDFTDVNRIATLIAGEHVVAGRYPQRIDHYAVLRTIEQMCGLAPVGASARARPITAIWST